MRGGAARDRLARARDRVVPTRPARWHPRRRAPSDRRPHRPDEPRERAREGRHRPRRDDLPPHARGTAGAGARSLDGVHACGRDPRRARRDRRGPVVARGRAARGRRAADHPAAAPLPDDRSDAGDRVEDGRAAGLPRSGQLVLRAPGGPGPARRAVRAQPADLGARRDPGGLSRAAAAAGPRADRGLPRCGRRAHPALRRDGDQDRDQRARRLHARRALPDGARARNARAARARRLLDLRHRVRRRSRQVRRGMDRGRPAERQHVGARRAPLRRLRAPDLVHRGTRVRGLRGRVQDPLSRRGAARGPPAQDRSALRPPAGQGRRDGRALRLGAPALVRALGACARRVLLRPRQLVRGGRRGVPRRSRGRRGARPDELREVHPQRHRRRGAARPAVREPAARRDRPHGADADVHAPWRHRDRRHRDADLTGHLVRRLGGCDRDARPRLDRAPRPG